MEKEYSNEMRGTLWVVPEPERKENGPVAKGTATISGVTLQIAMWPRRTVDKAGSKAYGKSYMPISFEYPKGAAKFLAGVLPANVTVTAAAANSDSAQGPVEDCAPDDMPF